VGNTNQGHLRCERLERSKGVNFTDAVSGYFPAVSLALRSSDQS
jgi:hypothetical protein